MADPNPGGDLYVRQERFGNERLELQLNPAMEVSKITFDFSFLAHTFPKGAKIRLICGKSVLELRNCDEVWNKFSNRSESRKLSSLVPVQTPRTPQHDSPPAVYKSRKRRHESPSSSLRVLLAGHGNRIPGAGGAARLPYSTETSPSSRRRLASPHVVTGTESNSPTKKRRIAPQSIAMASSSSRTVEILNQEINVTSGRAATSYVDNTASTAASLKPNQNVAGLVGGPSSEHTGYPVQLAIPSHIPVIRQVHIQGNWKGKAQESERAGYVPNYPCAAPVTVEAPVPTHGVLETDADAPAKNRKIAPQPFSSTHKQTHSDQEINVAPSRSPPSYVFEPLPPKVPLINVVLAEISSLDLLSQNVNSLFNVRQSSTPPIQPLHIQPITPSTSKGNGRESWLPAAKDFGHIQPTSLHATTPTQTSTSSAARVSAMGNTPVYIQTYQYRGGSQTVNVALGRQQKRRLETAVAIE